MLDEPFNHEHEVNVSQCNFLTEIIYNFSKIILQTITMPIAFLLLVIICKFDNLKIPKIFLKSRKS